MKPTTFVGLDVHKRTTSVAIADRGRGGEVRFLGEIPSTPEALHRLVERLKARHPRLSFCYEAGPCGYGVHRLLSGLWRAFPSTRRAVARARTRSRIASWAASGTHTGVSSPARCSLASAVASRRLVLTRSPGRVGISDGAITLHSWPRAYRRWLTTVRFDHPAQQIVLQDYIHAVEDAEARLARLEHQIEELLPSWSMAPVVEAVQAMRGVGLIVAITVVAEVGDFSRFANARQLMAYLGLVPSEHSSGTSVRRGGITKAGNAHARRVLIEGAWTYRMQARVSRKLLDRLERLPQAIRDIAWRAQLRLCQRYRRLAAAGKPKVVVTTAIAREMVGFIWAIACVVQPRPAIG